MSKNKPKTGPATIAVNRRARHEYFIEDTFEAGISFEGWEVKSLRAGRVQLNESYAFVRDGEVWLFGVHLSPLASASTHVSPDATRTRRLLLHREEINRLIGAVERKGYALVPLSMYWKRGRAKLELGLAKGKKQHDKRDTEREREWSRNRERLLKHAR
ncbi:MAG: SsrA-binding protein SmpB [Acidihalobacter sp.]|jgi:SsrA-binding protein|uniref:SsrA-binding protein SmpB n=1 Tax=Acidihalobacter sp. TaxID=1872108 RepID=UPI00307E7D3B